MKIEIAEYKGIKVIALSGEVDMHTSPELRKEMMKLISRGRLLSLLISGAFHTFDSSGIATFVEGLKGIMSYNRKLKLIGSPTG